MSALASQTRTVTALFTDRNSADRAYRVATELGYGQDDIDVMMSDETRQRLFPGHSTRTELAADVQSSTPAQSKTAKELGGPTGGTIGTTVPVVAAIGALLLLPGAGLALAGPIAAAVTAATAAGIAGGVAAALTHWGVPRSRVKDYEDGIRNGGILLGVRPRSQSDSERIVRGWQDNGGRSVHS